ncbi:MAG: hypothetical protein KAS96_05105 [Planctomycetes bacterium]|nr:hypothetical protein [Planctomycetota bacterium]
MHKKIILTFLVIVAITENLFAAVGCTLNDPDRDIKRLFKKATNYKTEFIAIKDRGDENLVKEIEAKLKDKLEPTYESIDVPYAYYTVLSKKQTIGYVHGVNQKGTYGAMQLILATDANGVIIDFYYQKITSPQAKTFKDKKFTKQFIGLSLADFYTKDIKEIIKKPDKENNDYLATLRGTKKNLILHDEFYLKNKYDKYFYQNEKKGDKK